MKFGGTLFSENHTCLMNFTKNLGWLTNQPWKPTVERIQPEKLPIEPKKFVDFQKYNTKDLERNDHHLAQKRQNHAKH
jgi:hypothetical protein